MQMEETDTTMTQQDSVCPHEIDAAMSYLLTY